MTVVLGFRDWAANAEPDMTPSSASPNAAAIELKRHGITDVTIVAGGGAKAVDLGEETMDGFVGRLDSNLKHAAAA